MCSILRTRWPTTLEQLAPDFITEVPEDIFGTGALRLRVLEDGLVIYSVGPDGVDDGGVIRGDQPNPAGPDLGFRLWNPERRRQPAR